MDKFLVRASAILINVYLPITLICSLNGMDISVYDYICSSSIMFGLVLSVLAHSQGKYHCKWIRGLCYNSAAVPAVGYIDASYSIFDDAISFIIAIASVWSIGVIITLALAVKHFYKVKKVTKGRYEELRPIKCNCTRKD